MRRCSVSSGRRAGVCTLSCCDSIGCPVEPRMSLSGGNMLKRTIVFAFCSGSLALGCVAESDKEENLDQTIEDLIQAGIDDIQVIDGVVYTGFKDTQAIVAFDPPPGG